MKIAIFQYKCRRCGEIFDSASERRADQAELVLLHSLAGPYDESNVSKLMIHPKGCVQDGDTGMGVGDLAGFRIGERR